MYIQGNAVRELETDPRRQEPAVPEQPKRVSRQVRKNRKKAMHMSPGYVIFLSAAAIVGLAVCINFLKIRSEVTASSSEITAMQQTLATMKEENNTKYNNIMDSVSLEEVRRRAIDDLGMVYADAGQIIEYENPENDYMKQYEEIPESGVLASNGKVSN